MLVVADDILTQAFKRAEEEMSRLKMVNAALHDEIDRLRQNNRRLADLYEGLYDATKDVRRGDR